MNQLIVTKSVNPWHNLALEELIFDRHESGVNLYLWQNQNTVVIGRNQNAWKECRHEELERDGGKLARRSSGGGAVFHDLGNLNFTFTTVRKEYDLGRQLGVIISAVNALGIEARFTGRNDIVTHSGAKFSGNAFRYSQFTGMHHGTILVDVDMTKLGKYLAPSESKLKSKGVESVRARVCNLTEYQRDLTISRMRDALIDAFKREYGACRLIEEKDLDQSELAIKEEKYGSWEWRLGNTPVFDLNLCNRFSWGEVELQLRLSQGVIAEAAVFSDAMDEAFILRLPGILKGVRCISNHMAAAVRTLNNPEAQDLSSWLETICV